MAGHEVSPEDVRNIIKGHLDIEPERGIVRIFGIRFCLATPDLLVVLQKALEGIMGNSAKAPVYMAGEEAAKAGAEAARDLLERGKFGSEEHVILYLSRLWSAYGHGRISINFVDFEQGRVTFTIDNSLIAEAYGPSERPVCHFYAGYGAGLVGALIKKTVHCEEVACAAAGAERCEFQIAPLEEFSAMLPRIMEARTQS